MRTLYNEERIKHAIAELARKINADYADAQPLFVGVLTGSFIFAADLLRCVTLTCDVDFVRADSYGDATSTSGEIKISGDMKVSPRGRDVIILDEIVDSGLTLKTLVGYFKEAGAKSVKSCALVDKPSGRKVEVTVDYVGLVARGGFLVGYGLDWAGKMRNLPAIYEVEGSD